MFGLSWNLTRDSEASRNMLIEADNPIETCMNSTFLGNNRICIVEIWISLSLSFSFSHDFDILFRKMLQEISEDENRSCSIYISKVATFPSYANIKRSDDRGRILFNNVALILVSHFFSLLCKIQLKIYLELERANRKSQMREKHAQYILIFCIYLIRLSEKLRYISNASRFSVCAHKKFNAI